MNDPLDEELDEKLVPLAWEMVSRLGPFFEFTKRQIGYDLDAIKIHPTARGKVAEEKLSDEEIESRDD